MPMKNPNDTIGNLTRDLLRNRSPPRGLHNIAMQISTINVFKTNNLKLIFICLIEVYILRGRKQANYHSDTLSRYGADFFLKNLYCRDLQFVFSILVIASFTYSVYPVGGWTPAYLNREPPAVNSSLMWICMDFFIACINLFVLIRTLAWCWSRQKIKRPWKYLEVGGQLGNYTFGKFINVTLRI
jgi:hypothetical protein